MSGSLQNAHMQRSVGFEVRGKNGVINDDVFSGAADINEDNGIYYGNPDEPVDEDKYVPMYDRNLSGAEKEAWDALVRSEMQAMELQYKEEADAQMKPLQRKDGKYGNYQQTGQVTLDIESGSQFGALSTKTGFGARDKEVYGNSNQGALDQAQIDYDRSHPVTIAAAPRHGGGGAAPLRRAAPVVDVHSGTFLSGIGKSELTNEQIKQKQREVAAQAEIDRRERELNGQLSPGGNGSRPSNLDRSYRAKAESPGDDYSSGVDRLAATAVNRDSMDMKRRKQAEYQEQLRSDREQQQLVAQQTSREHEQRTLRLQPPADASQAAGSGSGSGSSYAPEDKRAAQARYRAQLQQQTSANEREKAAKQAEINERRLDQQRARDMDMLNSQEAADLAERQISERERQKEEMARLYSYREAVDKLAREEEAAAAVREKEAARVAAREAAETGGVLPGGSFRASLPLAERVEHYNKLHLMEKSNQQDAEVARSLRGVVQDKDRDSGRSNAARAQHQDSFSSSSTDVFHGMGNYQTAKADKDLRRDAQQAYVRALEKDRTEVLPNVARVGLRKAREEPDHYVQENIIGSKSSSLPRSGKVPSMAEPGLLQAEVGWNASEAVDAQAFAKRQAQTLYAQQLREDKEKQAIFSPRKPFARQFDDDEGQFSARSSNASIRSTRHLSREEDGYWPNDQSGAGGLFANGMQSIGPTTRQTIKKSSQSDFQDQLARDADVRARAKADEASRQKIENHRSSRNVGRPNSEVGGPNGGFIGVDREEANPQSRVPLRKLSSTVSEPTGFPIESQQINTAARNEESGRKRQDYVAQLQADAVSPRIEHTRIPLNELKKRDMMVGGYPAARAAGMTDGPAPSETGMRIGLATPDRIESEKQKLNAYNEARKRDESAKAIEQTRRASPRRPDPAVKRAQLQAEHLRQLEATGARLTETERELLDTYNMSLQLETMSAESNSEFAAYNRSRSSMNSGFDATRMGSQRGAGQNNVNGDNAADAYARKRQQQQDYIDSLEQARNQPPIEQTRVPLLQLRRDEETQLRASLPGGSTVLTRAGSAGAGEARSQISARDYQIQRSNGEATASVQQQHARVYGNGTVADVMAQGMQKTLPNWGRSVGGGPSSFSISGAPPANVYGLGVPAAGFELNGRQPREPQQAQAQVSPRSRIDRKGDSISLKERLYSNPLGY